MKQHIFVGLLLVSNLVFAQDPQPYASLVEPKALKENLSIIASDAMEGRFTGSRGQKMAAAFIADHFQRLGLAPINNGSYYQPFNLYTYKQGEVSIATPTKKFSSPDDVVFYGTTDSGGSKTIEVVFVGLGSDADLEQVVVKDRMVMLIAPDLDLAKTIPIVTKVLTDEAIGVMVFALAPDPDYKAFMSDLHEALTKDRMSLQRADPEETGLHFVSKN